MKINYFSKINQAFVVSTLLSQLFLRQLMTGRTIAIMVYKSFNELAPEYLRLLFNSRNSVTSYTLRDADGKLAFPTPCTNYFKNSFAYSGAMLWNNLPIHLRKASSLRQFKAGLQYSFYIDTIAFVPTALMESRYFNVMYFSIFVIFV